MSDLIKKSEDADLETMPSFDFILEKEAEQQTQVAEHRAWLKSIKHERPLPKHHYKVAVYIRYFNQTKHEDYSDAISPAVFSLVSSALKSVTSPATSVAVLSV